MAGTKGKVGGRDKGGVAGKRVCDFCKKEGEIDKDVIRVKFCSGTGSAKMAWACKDGNCH